MAAADGTSVRGWLVLPDGASSAAAAPLLLWLHGGHYPSWNAWSWRWDPWLMAVRGYVARATRPSGNSWRRPDLLAPRSAMAAARGEPPGST